jgi:hypothetical protein
MDERAFREGILDDEALLDVATLKQGKTRLAAIARSKDAPVALRSGHVALHAEQLASFLLAGLLAGPSQVAQRQLVP